MPLDHDREFRGVALVIVDMMNRFDFGGADALLPSATAAARSILRLRDMMDQAGRPVIYVNDNFGEWHSDQAKLVERAMESGHDLVEKLRPRDHDYFIMKPQFSGFYATNLPVLLPKLGVGRLILVGIQTDICVLFTAAAAHMRNYTLWVPEDAVAAEDDARGNWALAIMRESMGARTSASTALGPDQWLQSLDEQEG